MNEHNTSTATRYLPQVAIATTLVAVIPVLVVWWLRDAGIVTSPWLCIGLAIALSLVASLLGSAYWQRRSGSGDVFFSELLLWGWLHRFRVERRLAKTAGLLGLTTPGRELVGPEDQIGSGGESLERTTRLLRQMAAALDAQDSYTEGHSRRVALHSAMVARKLGLGREEVTKVRAAAAVHDIGKLRVPSELLNKPGELSVEEFEIVKRHPDDGAKILSCMEDPEITGMVRHHHERFDGTGYPSGLKGEEAPLGARIIAVADTFDALTSVRPYRKAIAHKRALETIVAVSGTQLDPAVVRAFLRCYSANRAVLFWTLLAVSPQRALAWIRGRNPGRSNLASATVSVATPAALAAVVMTALGTAGSVATAHPPLRVAQRTPGHAAVSGSTAKPRSRRVARATGPAAVRASHPARRQAVLGVSQTRHGLIPHSQRTGSGSSGTASGGGFGPAPSRGSGGASGKPPTSPPHRGKGGTTTQPTTFIPPPSGSGPPLAVTVPTPTASVPTSSSGGGGSPSTPGGTAGGGPGGGSGPPTGGGSGSGSGGDQGGTGAGQGGSGGNQGGSGGPGGGPGGPITKQDCKNDGYSRFGFANQGQCVAYVERNLHH